jgi:hypothetical protein
MAYDSAGPPLYLILLGMSANVFAVGSVLVGIVARGYSRPHAFSDFSHASTAERARSSPETSLAL